MSQPAYLKRRLLEFAASILTIAGVAAGSTTYYGAILYLVSLVFWFWMMFKFRMWGLAPLNVVTLVVATWNVVRA